MKPARSNKMATSCRVLLLPPSNVGGEFKPPSGNLCIDRDLFPSLPEQLWFLCGPRVNFKSGVSACNSDFIHFASCAGSDLYSSQFHPR